MDEIELQARILRALACPNRLRIIAELRRGERCLCELQPRFRCDKSTLSRHVQELKRAGIVAERPVGPRRHLRLQTPCVLQMLACLRGVLRAGTSGAGRGVAHAHRGPRRGAS